MGWSTTSREDLSARAAYRRATGSMFAHTAAMYGLPYDKRTIHESVDPRRRNSRGEQIRECLDSAAHPLTVPVVIGFDETGSMGEAPRLLQEKLATLKGATLRMGLDDVQLCFAAYGDAQNNEIAPCQVGQFESGLEMEEWLNNLYLEGNGGGNYGETSGLLLYFLANYTRLDSLTKRGKKGYLILTGDERPLPQVTREEIQRYIGAPAERSLRIEEVVEQAKRSFDIYFFLVDNMAARMQGSLKVWRSLLGADHVIVVESLDTISEQIALLLARCEGAIDSIEDGTDVLIAEGADPKEARNAGKALARISPVRGDSAKATGTLPEPATAGVRRL